MNRFLVKALRIINGIVAIIIILLMTLMGIGLGYGQTLAMLMSSPDVGQKLQSAAEMGPVLGGIGGLLGGIVFAALTCGPLAVLIEIPGKLGEIRDALNRRSL